MTLSQFYPFSCHKLLLYQMETNFEKQNYIYQGSSAVFCALLVIYIRHKGVNLSQIINAEYKTL